MSESAQSLTHSRWNCNYHMVFVPNRRRKVLFGHIRQALGPILHELPRQKECQIIAGMGEIVHEIDLRDGRYTRPETAGIDAVLKGWLLAGFSDAALEAHGIALFEGLYTALERDQKKMASGGGWACGGVVVQR